MNFRSLARDLTGKNTWESLLWIFGELAKVNVDSVILVNTDSLEGSLSFKSMSSDRLNLGVEV